MGVKTATKKKHRRVEGKEKEQGRRKWEVSVRSASRSSKTPQDLLNPLINGSFLGRDSLHLRDLHHMLIFSPGYVLHVDQLGVAR